MTIASQIQDYADGLTASYNMVSQRGGTIPQRKNMQNLSTAIATIPSGGTFYGIPREKVDSGTSHKLEMPQSNYTYIPPAGINVIGYGALRYAFASCTDVVGADLTAIEQIGVYGMSHAFDGCSHLTGAIDLTNLKSVASYGLESAFYSTAITSVDLSGTLNTVQNYAFNNAFASCRQLVSADISGIEAIPLGTSYSNALYNMFNGCVALTTVNFKVKTIQSNYCLAYMFKSCTSLTTLDLSSLTSANALYGMNNMCNGCISLTSVDLSELTYLASSAASYMFDGCTSLTTMSFTALATLNANSLQYAFRNCTALTTLNFPALTSAQNSSFANTLNGCTGVTVHFPAAMQSTMQSWTNIQNGMGGTNTTVLFDL